jgi:hypothetical protein
MTEPASHLIQLKDCDLEDIEVMLGNVESCLGFKFAKNELAHVKTFGQLCDVIYSRLPSTDRSDCTTQQAFYKLRSSIAGLHFADKKNILPATRLEVFFPRKNRRQEMKRLEDRLGFHIVALRPKRAVFIALIAFSLLSGLWVFIHWKWGLTGLALAYAGFKLASSIGKEWEVQTVGELAVAMTNVNYRQSRRDPGTINKVEINNLLIKMFSENLIIEPIVLTREAPLF